MIDFIGRTHILLLHLPIGILLLSVLLEWLNFLAWFKTPVKIRRFIIGSGFLFSLFTVISGFLLSQNGIYNPDDIFLHKITAIFTSVAAGITFLTFFSKYLKYIPWLSLVLGAGITLTGHFGGTITHGKGFLFNQEQTDVSKLNISIPDIDNALLFEDIVKPILDYKCGACHGEHKKKGKLSLQSKESILKGGKSGLVLLNKNLEKSEILVRINSDLNEKEHMPPKRKSQLSQDEATIIQTWIDKGASFDLSIPEIDSTKAFRKVIDEFIQSSEDQSKEDKNIVRELPNIKVNSISSKLGSDLSRLQIVALNVGENNPFLDVNFVNVDSITDEHWDILGKISENVVSIKMTGQNVSDSRMNILGNMQNLTSLILDQCPISDSGIKELRNLNYLEYLNLNNTQISNEGLLSLKDLPKIKKIFAIGTLSTSDIKNQMQYVNLEKFNLEALESDTQRVE